MRALREQERAAALEKLGRAEAERRAAETDLEQLERRLRDLVRSAQVPSAGTVATAGALASGSRRHDRERRRIDRLGIERSAAEVRLRDAEQEVERAREQVVSATRALRAIGL